MADKIKIGALISGGGTNLQAIIDSCEAGKIDGEMVFVGSDNPDAKGLQRGEKHGIPTFIVDYGRIIRQYRENPDTVTLPADFDLEDLVEKQGLFVPEANPEKVNAFLHTRAVAEAALIVAMQSYGFDLLVLAGFMRNLTPYLIDRLNTVPGKPVIMNIHPALLPSFPGVDGYGDTYRYGCKVGGCTVHFIDYGEDSGPIIGQRAFEIQPGDSLDTIKANGLKQEWILYPACIQLFAEGRLSTELKTFTTDSGQEIRRTLTVIAPPA